MPSGRLDVVMVGATPTIVIENDFSWFPEEFVALMVKMEVTHAWGVPEITPVDVFRDNPVGKAPLCRLHVIGVVPDAASVWL